MLVGVCGARAKGWRLTTISLHAYGLPRTLVSPIQAPAKTGNSMALVRCSECGKEVSNRAAACPHCGNPLPPQPPEANRAGDQKKPWHQRSFSAGAGCLILVAVFGLPIWFASQCSSESGSGAGSRQPAPRPTSIDLGAAVNFTGTQFIVTNNDTFNWLNCKLEINSGIVRGGYEMTTPLIQARTTQTIGAMQFAKSSGERFNPLSMKPNSFSIACDTPQGRGYSFGEWK